MSLGTGAPGPTPWWAGRPEPSAPRPLSGPPPERSAHVRPGLPARHPSQSHRAKNARDRRRPGHRPAAARPRPVRPAPRARRRRGGTGHPYGPAGQRPDLGEQCLRPARRRQHRRAQQHPGAGVRERDLHDLAGQGRAGRGRRRAQHRPPGGRIRPRVGREPQRSARRRDDQRPHHARQGVRRRGVRAVLVLPDGRRRGRGGQRPQPGAAHRRHRRVLGQQRLRPARRGQSGQPRDVTGPGLRPERHRPVLVLPDRRGQHRRRLPAQPRGALRRHRTLLGPQRGRPARRRHHHSPLLPRLRRRCVRRGLRGGRRPAQHRGPERRHRLHLGLR